MKIIIIIIMMIKLMIMIIIIIMIMMIIMMIIIIIMIFIIKRKIMMIIINYGNYSYDIEHEDFKDSTVYNIPTNRKTFVWHVHFRNHFLCKNTYFISEKIRSNTYKCKNAYVKNLKYPVNQEFFRFKNS